MTASEATKSLLDLNQAGNLRNQFRLAHDQGDHPSHPVLRIGEALANRIHGGEKPLTVEVDGLLTELEGDAEETYAQWLADFSGTMDVETNKEKLKETLTRLAFNDQGQKVSAEEFEKRINALYNPVLTGHPTYRKNADRDKALSEYVAHKAGSKEHGPETRERLTAAAATPFNPPNLKAEWDQNLAKLHNIHAARKIVRDVAIEVGREQFPEDWTKLTYAPISVGTWMFYDWDGRKDITWNKTTENRFLLKELMLTDYLKPLKELENKLQNNDRFAVAEIIKRFEKTVELERGHREFCANYDPQKDDKQLTQLADWNTKLVQDRDQRVTHPAEIIKILQEILPHTEDPEIKAMVVGLCSDLTTQGISYAQPHFRISSTSVRSAFEDDYKIEISDHKSADDQLLGKIESLIAQEEPKVSNFLDVASSGKTIFTQMTLARQFADEIDSHCPTSYLVAETHNASIIKATLLYARKTGVDRHINVTPLIEDEPGIDAAEEIMQDLYKSSAYCDHVTGERPHNPRQNIVKIELGYSDASIGADGMNITATGPLHDRNIHRFVKNHAGSKSGLREVPLVIYHTGGHFMGRGLHPGGIADSQEFLTSRHFLGYAKNHGVNVTIERSFQGGSGQTALGTPEACLADFTQNLGYLSGDYRKLPKDPFYEGRKDDALATVAKIKKKHLEIGRNEGNIGMAAIFQNVVPTSGSRPSTAVFDGGDPTRVKLRAIRNNASVAQTGGLNNVLYGIGATIDSDPQAFAALATESEVFRRTRLAPVVRALGLSDPGIRESYIKLYDPNFWINRANFVQDKAEKENCRSVADYLKQFGFFKKFKDVVGDIAVDHQKTKTFLKDKGLLDHADFQKPTIQVSPSQIANTEIAHGARIYAMMELFQLAVSIPEIAYATGTDKDKMVSRIMCLDPTAIDDLAKIFSKKPSEPLQKLQAKMSEFTEAVGYTDFTDSHVDPMRQCQHIINRTAHIVADYVGGVG